MSMNPNSLATRGSRVRRPAPETLRTLVALSLIVATLCGLHLRVNAEANPAKEPALPKTGGELFDRFFLVRAPDFVYNCTPLSDREAIAILGVKGRERKPRPGEEFFVITPSSAIMRGKFRGLAQQCEPYYPDEEVVLGILALDAPLQWSSAAEPRLGIAGGKPALNRVGSIRPLKGPSERGPYLRKIRARIPAEEDLSVMDMLRITVPKSRQEYVFAWVMHFDPIEYQRAGDKAAKDTGFLFARTPRGPRLLVEEEGLTHIIAITDLDRDGVFEVLVHKGDTYQGTYEMRTFDGSRFTATKRILYEWMD